MDFVCICNHCGKTIERNFVYCPWCGKENSEPSDSRVLENVFSQLEAKQADDRNSRVRRIEIKIAEIEKGLDDLGIKN
ncbi:MAG: zinc-ribbon domain-containing protein [Treponema sp.]|nr:zinc-ribbon domain-containing protein [Treponema sp.]